LKRSEQACYRILRRQAKRCAAARRTSFRAADRPERTIEPKSRHSMSLVEKLPPKLVLDAPSLRFLHSGRLSVNGFCDAIDCAFFCGLLHAQRALGVSGAVAEIGVWEGLSFIPLVLGLGEGERALAIDGFELAGGDGAAERYGVATEERLRANVARHTTARPDQVAVWKRLSTHVEAREILEHVGPVRFFSIDGHHSYEAVLHDLDIAAESLGPDGIVAVDDFSNHQFPEVCLAVAEWLRHRKDDLAPFAITPGKLYLSRPARARHYKEALARLEGGPAVLDGETAFLGAKIGVWLPRAKATAKTLAKKLLRTLAPSVVAQMRRWQTALLRSIWLAGLAETVSMYCLA
jgi:hypothetical protein